MRSSINCILVGLASYDSLLVLTSSLSFGFIAIANYKDTLEVYKRHVYPFSMFVTYPLSNIARSGSAYLTLAVTIERYLVVCHPLRARTLCTYGRARRSIIVVTIFSLLYNLPKFFENYAKVNICE